MMTMDFAIILAAGKEGVGGASWESPKLSALVRLTGDDAALKAWVILNPGLSFAM